MNKQLLDEAAHWLARMHASDFSDSEQAAMEQWSTQSPAHEEVWRSVLKLKRQLQDVPSSVGIAVLNRPTASFNRRHLLRNTALALTTAPILGWLTYQQLPWQVWSADYSTSKGQMRTVALPDGSHVMLNTASAFSVQMRSDSRVVQQYKGEILVETAHTTSYRHRPFIVQTTDGQMQALGTKFLVRKHVQGTTLSVLEGAVRTTPSRLAKSLTVHANQQLRFSNEEPGIVTPLGQHADAWAQGVLYAENMRLADFLSELERYRDGVLLCDPNVAELRVSGVYQLSDIDHILKLLTQALGVRLQTRTRYWVRVVQA